MPELWVGHEKYDLKNSIVRKRVRTVETVFQRRSDVAYTNYVGRPYWKRHENASRYIDRNANERVEIQCHARGPFRKKEASESGAGQCF